MLAGGFAMLPFGVVAAFRDGVSPAPSSVAAWFYLVVFGSVVAFTSYVWLVANAPISLVATYAYVNPVIAVLLGHLVLGEEITAVVLTGGAIVVASVAVVITAERVRPSG
jgi:drug/metabolite transporter (DMT)-like permease